MRKHTWAGRALRALFVGILVLPLLGYFAPTASAHHPILSVDAGCSIQSGEWTVTWTVANGDWSDRTMTVDKVDYSDGQLSNIAVGLILGPNEFTSDTVHYLLSDTSVKTLTVRADWSDGGPQDVVASLSLDLSSLDSSRCTSPQDVSVTGWQGPCTWNGESSETPVTVVIDPESGATVTITGPGGPYEFTGTGGSVNLGPGNYSFTAVAADGYVLTGDSSGEFTIGDCPPPPPTTSPPIQGTITIVKITEGGAGTFSFTSATLGSFDLTTSLADTPVSKVFSGLDPGIYGVAEGALADGWSVASMSCSDGSSPAAINLSAGENVTCTFTNSFAEVAGEIVENTTTTTPPETLPFTGGSSSGAGGVGVGLLLLGGLMLLVLRKEPVGG